MGKHLLHRTMKSNLLYTLFVVLCIATVVLSDEPLYKNPEASVEARVSDLLQRMTLKEKIGQMTLIERSVADSNTIQSRFIGSIFSGGGSAPAYRASPSEWMDMVDGFQKTALGTRLGIPLLYGVDAVHGHNNVYGATIFPHNIGIGCTRDPALAKRIGAATALEVRGTGIPYIFAPCIAVCRHPAWGRCYESYSENPRLVKAMTEIIPGLQGKATKPGLPTVAGQNNVAATAKHYVGDGGTIAGIDNNNTLGPFRDLASTHMLPYFRAITRGVSSIMITQGTWKGLKINENRTLLLHLLKQKMEFKGFLVSDWQGMDTFSTPNYTDTVLMNINAGIDMIMVPYNYTTFQDDMLYLVTKGFIQMKRINDSVRRILQVKFKAGLFEYPFGNRSMINMVGAQEHRDLAREAVRKSLVLLKNGKRGQLPVIPLDKKATKILVAGSHANDIGNQCGGWTISWQGSSGNTTIGTTILEGIVNTVSKSTEVVYEESPDINFTKGKDFSYAIVVVGEAPYAEYMGDNANLTIPDAGIETIKNVCTNVRCVVVLISGRPLVIQPYVPIMDAFVAAWLPGTEGQGVSDVLFGDYPFQGKLSRTWFKRVDQLPMNVEDSIYDPLFPYGYGLQTNVTVG